MNTVTINGEQVQVSDELLEKIRNESGKAVVDTLKSYDDMVGKCWFIRTITYHQVGRISKIIGNMFVMEDASWVADSGRFMNALQDGKLNEVKPVGRSLISISSIVDMFPWNHPLPKSQK